jgi:threonine/homoserine/homoserine lactone efflux protein
MTSSLIAFAVFLFFWNVSPGPMVTLTSRNAAKYSFKGGFAIMCGILLCDIIYLTLAFLGVSEFIAKNEKIFYYAKILGAIYIFYIGASIVWNASKDKGYTSSEGVMKSFSLKKEFVRGFLTNLANPLTIVGMTSFILPFFEPSMPIKTQIIFAALVPFSTFYCFSGVTLIFGNPVIRNFILPRIVWFERVAGSVIIYMSIMIIFFDF